MYYPGSNRCLNIATLQVVGELGVVLASVQGSCNLVWNTLSPGSSPSGSYRTKSNCNKSNSSRHLRQHQPSTQMPRQQSCSFPLRMPKPKWYR
mmetsp:Transcript_23273/g.45193  ORF Transcript_23273/g.45193 Transcript_23273/m.45193 type:complete len:93 (+) Transcript_23273:463-741(+)